MKRRTLALSSLVLAVLLLAALSACGSGGASAEAVKAASTAVDTILSVGTTQAFTDEAVPEADIKTILRAGLEDKALIIG